jgi:hypothetical protein
MQKRESPHPPPDLEHAPTVLEPVDPVTAVALMLQQAEMLKLRANMEFPEHHRDEDAAIQDMSPLGR